MLTNTSCWKKMFWKTTNKKFWRKHEFWTLIIWTKDQRQNDDSLTKTTTTCAESKNWRKDSKKKIVKKNPKQVLVALPKPKNTDLNKYPQVVIDKLIDDPNSYINNAFKIQEVYTIDGVSEVEEATIYSFDFFYGTARTTLIHLHWFAEYLEKYPWIIQRILLTLVYLIKGNLQDRIMRYQSQEFIHLIL